MPALICGLPMGVSSPAAECGGETGDESDEAETKPPAMVAGAGKRRAGVGALDHGFLGGGRLTKITGAALECK